MNRMNRSGQSPHFEIVSPTVDVGDPFGPRPGEFDPFGPVCSSSPRRQTSPRREVEAVGDVEGGVVPLVTDNRGWFAFNVPIRRVAALMFNPTGALTRRRIRNLKRVSRMAGRSPSRRASAWRSLTGFCRKGNPT